MANLEFLRTFLLAADTGTFRRAATARSVTVSAISQQIKTLEAQLDVPLFERVGRRAQLTPHGRELARSLRPAFSQIDDALGSLTGTFQSIEGLVHVGMPRAFGRHWMRRRVAQLLETHPGLGLRLTLGVPSAIERRLVDGQLDLGILVRPPSASLEAHPIAEEAFVAVAAPQFLARWGTPRTEDDFAALPCGAFDTELSMLSLWWQLQFGHRAPLPRRVVVVVPDLDELVELAVEGVCLAVLPTYLVYEHLEEGRLVRLVPARTDRRSASGRSSSTIFLAWRKTAVLPARTVAVRDALARV